MNLSGLLPLFDALSAFERVTASIADHRSELLPLHLPAGSRAPFLARRIADRVRVTADARPILFILGRVDAVPVWQQLLETWLPSGTPLLRLPEPTPLPYDRGPWSAASRNGRLNVLTDLMRGQHPLLPAQKPAPVILCSARALLQKTLPRRRFMQTLRVLQAGQIIEPERLLTGWEEIGYERVSVVEQPGQFSRRGGIIDVYPPAMPLPVRVELFGDEIDTLRTFAPATQRTVSEAVERVVVPPARELLPLDAAQTALEWLDFDLEKDDDLPSWHDDIPDLVGGIVSPHLEYYLPSVYGQPASLLDYLPDSAEVYVEDWPALIRAVRDLEGQASKMRAEQLALPPDYAGSLWSWDLFAARLTQRPVVVLGDAAEDEPLPEDALAFQFETGPRYGGQSRPFIAHLKRAADLNQRTVVVSRQAQRLAELWRLELRTSAIFEQNRDIVPVDGVDAWPPDGSLTFVQGSINEGFILELDDPDRTVHLNLLTDAEIFGWRRPAARRSRRPRPAAPEARYADIEPGDYIVHVDYGVGQFIGLVTRQIGGERREYLQLRYTNDDMVYVPVHHADRLSKWIGPDDREPALQRLGGKRWSRAKEKAQEAVNRMADELLELYAVRETIDGHAFASDTEWQAEMEAAFPYLETEDQMKAIQEVKADMERSRPMDRLICGDVGYGKTEVALRAAFKAVMDGKQVAMLVPTTVLAQQHFETFRERLQPFPVNVALLSRLRTSSQQAKTLKGMREGSVDIVIGTHRLLSDDVSYKNLGLLVIDEEQRFGVNHKETLKQLRTEVDVLTLTATPIPRTLYMGLSGLRDISLIQTAPAERLPVQTYVGPADDRLIRKAILRELDRGGQVFFVHNRVQTIDAIRRKLDALIPEARSIVAHGQMPERRLEEAMVTFAGGDADMLICTTIIESGLDIPNANTLIVDRAELFGLSQLYQLRGRVGRGAQRAYAYFFHSPWRQITEDARARLETIEERTELGAGYAIAMRDLEIRGAGELLGNQQSGHIAQVGFDLYTRMLTQAVKVRKAQRRGESAPGTSAEGTLIDLPLPTYIPSDYVAEAPLRLRLYRRMAVLDSLPEIDQMAEELVDRFGTLPDPVENLLFQLRVKVLAIRADVTQVNTERNQLHIVAPGLEDMPQYLVRRFIANDVRVSRTSVWMPLQGGTLQWRARLVQVLEKLEEVDPSKLQALKDAGRAPASE